MRNMPAVVAAARIVNFAITTRLGISSRASTASRRASTVTAKASSSALNAPISAVTLFPDISVLVNRRGCTALVLETPPLVCDLRGPLAVLHCIRYPR